MKPRYRNAVRQFQSLLRKEYGTGLSDLLVFGSVARDTDTDASDIDVMIVLDGRDVKADWQAEKCVRGIALEVELDYGVVFDIKVMDREALQRKEGHTPFVERVFAEGVRA